MKRETDDYNRLLKAAKELRGWDGPAAISRNLTLEKFEVTESRIGNWKYRGISKDAILDMARIIGCRPLWLRDGTGQMKDAGAVDELEDEDLQEAINLLSAVEGRLRTKLVAYLEKEYRQLIATEGRRGNRA